MYMGSENSDLFVFSLTSSFRLLLASYAGLLVMLSLANLLLNAGLRAVSLKSAKSTVQSLVFLNYNVRHSLTPNLPPVENCAETN